jgi:hypothetical protein
MPGYCAKVSVHHWLYERKRLPERHGHVYKHIKIIGFKEIRKEGANWICLRVRSSSRGFFD